MACRTTGWPACLLLTLSTLNRDGAALQQLVALSVVAAKGWVKTDEDNNRVPIRVEEGDGEVCNQAKLAEIGRRQSEMRLACQLVYDFLRKPGQAFHGMLPSNSRPAAPAANRSSCYLRQIVDTVWAFSANNSTGVNEIFQRTLRATPLHDPERGLPEGRPCGRPLPSLGEGTRWADVAPFLGFRMEKRTLTEEEQLSYHKTEMYRLDDRDIRDMARPVAGAGDDTGGAASADRERVTVRAEQLLIALGRELGDLYEAREEMRKKAARMLLPRRQMIGLPYELKSTLVYHLMEEHVPLGSFDQQDATDAANLLIYARQAATSRGQSLEAPKVRRVLHAVFEEAKKAKEADRASRERREEASRRKDAARVTHAAERLQRVCALMPAAAEPLPAGGSSKLFELGQLLRELTAPGPMHGKAVVFTRFGEALAPIGAFLQGLGLGTVSLKPDKWWRAAWQREGGIALFTREPACKVLLLEADASAAGLTLTCARHVVFLDVLSSTSSEEQAMARVNRIGQKLETYVWHLLARDSLDLVLRDAADARKAGRSDAPVAGLIKEASHERRCADGARAARRRGR